MNALDAATVALLERTSTPEGRLAHQREILWGRNAYDTVARLGPRDYVTRCASPVCGLRFVVRGAAREVARRYCDGSCRHAAYYYRHRERRLATINAYQARRRALAREAA